MKKNIELAKLIIPGFLPALLIMMTALTFSRKLGLFADPLILAFLLGVLVRFVLGNRFVFWPGFAFVQDFFIPLGILLYASQVDWKIVSPAAIQRFTLPLGLALLGYYFFLVLPGKKLGLRRNAALLIWASCALLGPIAVVILTPLLEPTDDETSLSLILSVFTTLYLLPVLLLLHQQLHFSAFSLGTLGAITLPLIGTVGNLVRGFVQAASTASLLLGFKVMLLGPVAFSVYSEKKAEEKKKQKLPLLYILLFVLISILFSYVPKAGMSVPVFGNLARIILTLALAGVGLSCNLQSLLEHERKALSAYLVLSFLASAGAIALTLLGIKLTRGL